MLNALQRVFSRKSSQSQQQGNARPQAQGRAQQQPLRNLSQSLSEDECEVDECECLTEQLTVVLPTQTGPPPRRFSNANVNRQYMQRRADSSSHDGDGSESLEQALLSKAAELPIALRHELLAAAAANAAFVPAFASYSSVRDSCPTPKPQGVDALLRELFEKVNARGTAPAVAPPVTAGAAEPLTASTAAAAVDPPSSAPAPDPATVASLGPALGLALVPEFTHYGMAQEIAKAVVSLKAAKEAVKRPQVALTCVLDRSGSMSGPLIELVKETVHFLIDQLTEEDYLGLISYASSVTQDLPLIRMTAQAKALAHAIVQRLDATGGTALYDGLVLGVRQQMESERALANGNIVHACFLCTDGQANEGPSDADSILPALRAEQQPTNQNITVHTFGFGQGHSASLLQSIATAQSGVYYFVGKSEDVPTAYGDALGGLLSVVAKDVQVHVQPLGGAQLRAFRAGGRIGGAADAGADAAVPSSVSFNDIFAEETREILVELQLPAVDTVNSAASTCETLRVELSYVDMAMGQRVTTSQVLSLERSPEPRPADAEPHQLVYVTAMRYDTIAAIEEAQKQEEVTAAHNVLDAHIARLGASAVQTAEVTLMVQQAQTARGSIKPRFKFNEESIAMVSNTVQMLKQQRAISTKAESAGLYDNRSKAEWRACTFEAVTASYNLKAGARSRNVP